MTAVLGFYKFVALTDLNSLVDRLRRWGHELELLGTVLLAEEGINGSLYGRTDRLQLWRERLAGQTGLNDLRFTQTAAGHQAPFYKFKVRRRKEIIPLCAGTIKPGNQPLRYVDAQQWDELLDNPRALIVDVRNSFEYRVGHFPGAIDSGLESFSDLDRLLERKPAWRNYNEVGIYCTGGIRCEKASALWQSRFDAKVYQLQGGIIGYLQSTTEQNNRWQGDCFVFDYRVSLDRQLNTGHYTLCFGCGEPLTPSECDDQRYLYGVSCPYCHGQRSAAAVAASRERVRQIELARSRSQTTPQHSLMQYCLQNRVANDG